MSIWTHVVGAISVDSIGREKPLTGIVGKWSNEWLGATEYSPDSLENNEQYGTGPLMPEGSEGPLFYVVHRIGGRNDMNNGLITFWGNLRNYGDPEVEKELIPYFEDLIKRLRENHTGIRTMAIEIQVENGSRRLLTMGDQELIKICIVDSVER